MRGKFEKKEGRNDVSVQLIKKVVVYHQRSEDHMRGACKLVF